MVSQISPFQSLIDAISTVDTQDVLRVESKIKPLREMCLSDPLQGWALHFLSASRMGNARTLTDFIKADMLVRPFEAIKSELENEKSQQRRLQEVPGPHAKALERARKARVLFGDVIGGNPDSPTSDSLHRILGGESRLVETLGKESARELITAFLSTKDPNILIPACAAVINTLEELHRLSETYEAWQSRREIVAKGESRGRIIKRKVINQDELAVIDNKLKEIRESTPAIEYGALFNEAAAKAISVHEAGAGYVRFNPRTYSELREAWGRLQAGVRHLASFTHAGLAAIKQSGPPVSEISTGPEKTPASFQPAPAVDCTKPLIGQEDIDAWAKRHS